VLHALLVGVISKRYDELAAATDGTSLDNVLACFDEVVLNAATRRRFAVHVHCRAHPLAHSSASGGDASGVPALEAAVALDRSAFEAFRRGMDLYPAETS